MSILQQKVKMLCIPCALPVLQPEREAGSQSLVQQAEMVSDRLSAEATLAAEESAPETGERNWVQLSDQQLVPSIETFTEWSAISYEESIQLLKLIKSDEISRANEVLQRLVDRLPLPVKEKCRGYMSDRVESSAG